MLNHHLWKLFSRADRVFVLAAKSTGTSHVWQHRLSDSQIQATITKQSDGSFTITVQGKPLGAADSAYVNLLTGSFTPASDGTPHAGKGTLQIDLSAISGLVPAEVSTGQLTVQYQLDGATKTVQVTASNFQPDGAFPIRPPRNASFVFTRTDGVGGSLKFSEDVVLFCPSNPNEVSASVETVARWAHVNGSLVGRADSLGTGGQIATGNQWLGLTCFDMSRPDATAETYWQMKLEDGSGQVVDADTTDQASDSTDPSSTCNAAFGPVPSLSSNEGDFDFAAIDFSDSSIVPYPGMPAGK